MSNSDSSDEIGDRVLCDQYGFIHLDWVNGVRRQSNTEQIANMKTKSSAGVRGDERDVGGYVWSKVRSVLLLGFAAFALTAAGCASGSNFSEHTGDAFQAPSRGLPDVAKPTSQEEFFRNIKFAFDHGLLLRKDFYTKENMYRYFAAEKVLEAINRRENGDLITALDTADFDGIFPRVLDRWTSALGNGAQIAATYVLSLSGETQGILNMGFPWRDAGS